MHIKLPLSLTPKRDTEPPARDPRPTTRDLKPTHRTNLSRRPTAAPRRTGY
ncbi:hypothetical protein [Nonomuraea wenchangensis]|uniref:Uncharacterized protein n=1 Tax=Nonomuraea wenchangensis TaxID=568860 RepID=A0A1I0KRP2_9ACTN|nr:hypothetical protein [Nonomuraea wenchangensis]SEU27616.1 hypothetical protein SAMN05421811_10950 [Nonomuraea wenchangensis]